MPYSIKMAKLDFYTLKAQFGNYAALVLVIAMFCFMGASIVTLSITSAWYVALLMTNIFMIQEKNNLERLYASLSIDLQSIVLGRYIFIFIDYVIALLFSIIVGAGASIVKNSTVDVQEIVTAVTVSILVFTIIMGVQIPIYFRFGYTKAKMRCLIPYVLVLVIVVLPSFTKVFSNILIIFIQHQTIVNIACLLISIVIGFFSYKASMLCYKLHRLF